MFKLVLLFVFIASATSTIFESFQAKNIPLSETSRLPIPAYRRPADKVIAIFPPKSGNALGGRNIAILRSESVIAPDGSYQYAYDTENGISVQESGRLIGSGSEAAIAASGSYRYTSPEGVPVQITYVADENGFQPSGNLLPTSPPIPAAILRSIEYNLAHP